MFRLNDDRGRYIVGFNQGGVYLERENPWENFAGILASSPASYNLNQWYTLKIDVNLRTITVSVDGGQVLSYNDNSLSVIWNGTIGLEAVGPDELRVRFDDVKVTGVEQTADTWVKTGGPIGGLGYDVRYASNDLQVMYVTDNYSGVNKSNDGGNNWFATNRGIIGRAGSSGDAVPVFSLTVDPNNYNNVWAGLKDAKGAYKTTTAGGYWQQVTPDAIVLPEAEFAFRGFTIQQGNSNVVYAAGEIVMHNIGHTFDKIRGKVFKTSDAGVSWDLLWDGDNLARYIIVDPDDSQTLYVSLGIFDREAYDSDCRQIPPKQGTGGVIRSKDGGTKWEYLGENLGVYKGLTDMYVGSLVMNPKDPKILLAGAGNVACSRYWQGSTLVNTGGVFRTEDGGDSWQKTLPNDIITSVEFAPSDPQIAYAGGQTMFYRSQDGGKTWNKVAGGTGSWGPPGVVAGFPIDILVSPSDPYTLYVNNYGGGNIKSTDGGVTWSVASKGYTGALMFSAAIHPENNAMVYAAARSGAFRSTDGGSTWAGLSYPPATIDEMYSIALNPDQPNVILTAPVRNGKMFRSIDGGFSWTEVYKLAQVNAGDINTEHGFRSIAFAPSNGEIVYAGSCRVHVKLDAGVKDSFGVYKSVNGGLNWGAANNTQTEDECITDLVIHPNNPNIVYAATAANGLYKTIDGGVSWTPLASLSVSDVRSVAIDPTQPNIVYAGAQNGVVHRSPDAGSTWQSMAAGMDPNDSIWALQVDPLDTSVVWAGSIKTGVYRWDASQGVWLHVNAGLRTRAVTDLAISSDGEVLYATTWGEGVFRLGEVVINNYLVYLPLAIR